MLCALMLYDVALCFAYFVGKRFRLLGVGMNLYVLQYHESGIWGLICVDIAKITRKQSKLDKHGHGNGRARKKPGEEAIKVKKSTLRVIGSIGASGSKPTGNTKNNRISQSSSSNKTNKVEDQSKSIKSRKKHKNCVDKIECNAYVMQSMLNANSKSVCAICNECLFDANHDKCILDYVHDVNVLSKSKPAKRKNKKQIWKPTGKVYTEIGYKWKPTGCTFTIVGNKCPLTRFTFTKVVSLKETTTKLVITPTQGIMVYSRIPKAPKSAVQIVLWYLDFGCSKHMTGNRSQLTNFVNKFLGTANFGNDQIAKIMGYGDYQIGNVTISRVYYVEGLGHNLFSVGQFCNSDLEVAFRKHTCFVHNLEGVDLLMGSQGTNLYTLSIGDMMKSDPICYLSKASKTKSWLWHRRLSHLNFGNNNQLAKKVKFLRSKDEALEFIIKFLKMIQVRLNETVRNIRTDNGTKFVNQTLCNYYEDVDISHETSVARTPQQNDVVNRRNHTLVEAARAMLIYAKASLFMWAEAVVTACKLKAKADVGIFIGYATAEKDYRIYNRRTRRIMEIIHVDFDDLTAMAFEQSSSGPALHEMTPGTLNSGLVPQPYSSTPFFPPTRDDWDTLLQPLFDEYFCPPPCVDHPVPEVAAPVPTVSADHDIEVAYMDNNPQFGIPIPELSFEESSSQKFAKGTVDPTLFIKREGKDILLMSMMGKMAFFLRLQISQSPRGIFLNQSKYALEIIKKYGTETSDLVDTPMVEKYKLDSDPQGKEVNPTRYRGMIGSLMYLTASRPDL
ncbi:retrovirus-related pol polyprotein from transposon TNT 1-94 [Tanacetum coccineum]